MEPASAHEVASPAPPSQRSSRNWRNPAALYVATLVTTFLAGCDLELLTRQEAGPGSRILFFLRGSPTDGALYMLCVMAILTAHELGHYLQNLRYRVPASLPYFIPIYLPFMAPQFGTMGAVIGMKGTQANRKELFDIGISGPLAGLAVAIPLAILGIRNAQAGPVQPGVLIFGDPWLIRVLIAWLRELPPGWELALNPYLKASWVGLLLTGLNMMPVSQLDGGHVLYSLLGRRADWICRIVFWGALALIITFQAYNWLLMFLLVGFIGIYHPPTSNDRVPLGKWRTVLGIVSLALPLACLTPVPIYVKGADDAAREDSPEEAEPQEADTTAVRQTPPQGVQSFPLSAFEPAPLAEGPTRRALIRT